MSRATGTMAEVPALTMDDKRALADMQVPFLVTAVSHETNGFAWWELRVIIDDPDWGDGVYRLFMNDLAVNAPIYEAFQTTIAEHDARIGPVRLILVPDNFEGSRPRFAYYTIEPTQQHISNERTQP